MATTERRYPVGIQTFSEIIRGGYVYVDKTDLIWQMQRLSKYVFLSRPRRFGKSLLTSTLESFFRGEKELFKGLKVMELEQEWKQHPVIHLDMSTIKDLPSSEELTTQLFRLLSPYETLYGVGNYETTPGGRLAGIIARASLQTGGQVAIIIDEYDAPLLNVLHNDDVLPEYRRIMQEFYQPLKPSEPMIRFCFMTGITRLSQMNVFSTLNNLTNISMTREFATICGFTDEELMRNLSEGITVMADEYGCSREEMHAQLKTKYDGYHFAENSQGIYNPYSILNALALKRLGNYWFETGTPTFLIRQMQRFHTDITAMDYIEAPEIAFSRPTEAMSDILPLLYQTGYLTIKDYDRDGDVYSLAFPNQEVRVSYVDGLMPAYIGLDGGNVQAGFALKFWRALKKDDLELALTEMQAYLAGLPYVEGFRRKLDDVANAEGFYEWTFYLIFSMLNVYVRTQVKCIKGRVDMIVDMPDTLYVLELKTSGTAADALAQINSNGYALPYQTSTKRVVKAGLRFSIEERTLKEWAIEE